MDVLAHVQPEGQENSGNGNHDSDLKIVLERVGAFLERSGNDQSRETQHAIVILDDITMLEWIGFPLIDVARFVRALRAVCSKVRLLLSFRDMIMANEDFVVL